MANKKNDLITKYLSDMVGVEDHIYQAIDKQVKETQDEPDINPILRNIRDNLEQHTKALRGRLEDLGGQATSPVKEAGASVLGVAAGVIDKLRSEEVSKDLRDDYTALNLSVASYIMLNTTCLALNDSKTAELAARHMKENAQSVIDIGKLLPTAVVRDLKDEANLNKSAVQQAEQVYYQAWNSQPSA